VDDKEVVNKKIPHTTQLATTSWLLASFDADGEVIFVENKLADKPGSQGYAAPPSCLCPTSPSVSKAAKNP
jgi:hypothetical protein